MLIPRQTYVGRVIAPAKYFDSKKKPFITFVLAVNGLASIKNEKNQYERTSAKITCSYSIQSEDDMVATVLSRINSKDNEQSLGGGSYNSVMVAIEGTERLVQYQDSEGKTLPVYYKNLDFCSVSILDQSVVDLYKKEVGKSEERQVSNQTQQPNLAPKSQPVNKTASQPTRQEASVGYNVGDVITDPEGNEFEYQGGDVENMDNWKLVQKEPPPPVKKVPPFMKKVQQPVKEVAQRVNPVASALADEEEPSLYNMINNKESPV